MKGCLTRVLVVVGLLVLLGTGGRLLNAPDTQLVADVERPGTNTFNSLVAYPCYAQVGNYDEWWCEFTVHLQPHAGVLMYWDCDGGVVGTAPQTATNWASSSMRQVFLGEDGVSTWSLGKVHDDTTEAGGPRRCMVVVEAIASPDNVYAAQGFDISGATFKANLGVDVGENPGDPDPTPTPTPTPNLGLIEWECDWASPFQQGCNVNEPGSGADHAAGSEWTFIVTSTYTDSGNSYGHEHGIYMYAEAGHSAVLLCKALPSPVFRTAGTYVDTCEATLPRAGNFEYRSGDGTAHPIQGHHEVIADDPSDDDSDGDGFSDAAEGSAGTDPNDPADYPGAPTPTPTPTPRPPGGVEPPPDVNVDVDVDVDVDVEICESNPDILACIEGHEFTPPTAGGGSGGGQGIPSSGEGGSGVTECPPTPVEEKVGYLAYDEVPTVDGLAEEIDGQFSLDALDSAIGWVGDMLASIPLQGANAIKWAVNRAVDLVVPGHCIDAIIEARMDELNEEPPFSIFHDVSEAIEGAVAGAGSGAAMPTMALGGYTFAFPMGDIEEAVGDYRGIMGAAVWLFGALSILRLVAGTFGVQRSSGSGE